MDYFGGVFPPRTAKEAVARVEELTREKLSVDEVRRFMHPLGMKPRKTGHVPAKADAARQQQFLQEYLLPLLESARAGKCHLFFMDAAHFVLMPFTDVIWCFARMLIKAASGRNRINVLGALNPVTHKTGTVVNATYVNAETGAELLKKLAHCFNGLPIYMVLDKIY